MILDVALALALALARSIQSYYTEDENTEEAPYHQILGTNLLDSFTTKTQ